MRERAKNHDALSDHSKTFRFKETRPEPGGGE